MCIAKVSGRFKDYDLPSMILDVTVILHDVFQCSAVADNGGSAWFPLTSGQI